MTSTTTTEHAHPYNKLSYEAFGLGELKAEFSIPKPISLTHNFEVHVHKQKVTKVGWNLDPDVTTSTCTGINTLDVCKR